MTFTISKNSLFKRVAEALILRGLRPRSRELFVKKNINFTKKLDLINKSGSYHTQNTTLASNLGKCYTKSNKTTTISTTELMHVLEELGGRK
jgi:hypothetical protein